VKFLSNVNVKPPLHERKAPYWRLSLATVLSRTRTTKQ